MPIARVDRVKEQTTTTGTGTITLNGTAPTGFRIFSGNIADGYTVRYLIANSDQSEWEVGEGIFTASGTTLTRVTVFASSNSGSLVNFSAGTKEVSAVFTARDMRGLDFLVNQVFN